MKHSHLEQWIPDRDCTPGNMANSESRWLEEEVLLSRTLKDTIVQRVVVKETLIGADDVQVLNCDRIGSSL
jgi:hypothetical protein